MQAVCTRWSRETETFCGCDLTGRRQSASLARRLLAVAALLALALLATHAVAHWHDHAYDEDHCQVCHTGYAAIPQAVPQVAAQAPVLVARFAIGDASAPPFDFVGTPSIPRAPPA